MRHSRARSTHRGRQSSTRRAHSASESARPQNLYSNSVTRLTGGGSMIPAGTPKKRGKKNLWLKRRSLEPGAKTKGEVEEVHMGESRKIASTGACVGLCLPRLPGGAHFSPLIASLKMSGLFKKARKKAKGVVDSLRPPLRQGRSPSPEPQASEHSTPYVGTNPSATPPLQLHVTTTISTPTPSGSSMLMPGADSAQPASSASSPVHATPSYARPSAPLSALSTTGSAIYELLATIRDASDMCLPLKAAAVGVLKIWDVCEVRCFAASVVHPAHTHLIAYHTAQSRIHQAQG